MNQVNNVLINLLLKTVGKVNIALQASDYIQYTGFNIVTNTTNDYIAADSLKAYLAAKG